LCGTVGGNEKNRDAVMAEKLSQELLESAFKGIGYEI
jgi:hypothetical protein